MKLGRDQRWFESPCPGCGRKHDGVTAVDSDVPPNAGDFSVCIDCATVSVFDVEGRLQLPSVPEALEAAQDPVLQHMRSIVLELNRSHKPRKSQRQRKPLP